jgi:FixJ family two-component response regulator
VISDQRGERRPVVYVVDDDGSMRKALDRLLRSGDFAVELFASAQEFLSHCSPEGTCLVLDVWMPGMTGLELQQHLASARPGLPIVMITADDSQHLRQQALNVGASAVLHKPFAESELLNALEQAIGGGRSRNPTQPGGGSSFHEEVSDEI